MLSISNLIFNIAPFTKLLHKRMSARVKVRFGRMHFATDLTQDLVSKNERFKCKKYLLCNVFSTGYSLFHIIDRFLAADIHD